MVQERDGKVITYRSIDTTPGQSGSAIHAGDAEAGMNTYIVGVHTGGDETEKQNWGTFLTQEHLLWLFNQMGLFHHCEKFEIHSHKSQFGSLEFKQNST